MLINKNMLNLSKSYINKMLINKINLVKNYSSKDVNK